MSTAHIQKFGNHMKGKDSDTDRIDRSFSQAATILYRAKSTDREQIVTTTRYSDFVTK